MIVLLISSLFGKSIPFYFDPVTAKEATQPALPCTAWRHHKCHTAKTKKRYSRFLQHRTNGWTCAHFRSSDRYFEWLGCTIYSLCAGAHHGDSSFPVPGPHFQEAWSRAAARSKCVPSHHCHHSFKHRKPHYRKHPRSLDLSDPIFRHGLGIAACHLHNGYLHTPSFCSELPVAHGLNYRDSSALLCVNSALIHPCACRAAMPSKSNFPIIWDSGASLCISNDKSDFVGQIKLVFKHVHGISSNSSGVKVWEKSSG